MYKTSNAKPGAACAAVAAFAVCASIALAAPVPDAAALAAREQKEIAILRSDAKPGDKAVACKRLAICGRGKAVPALAPLLSDTQLASWSRIALEAIPAPAADQALRAATGELQGRLLIGVINSIARRRDGKAVQLLVRKLDDGDSGVASAAAVALGTIGGGEAVAALTPRLASAPPQLRPAVAEGCILAAEALLETEHRAEAMALYDEVRGAPVSKQKRIEATRGAILSRQAEGIGLLAEQLASSDRDLFGLGLRVARELKHPDVAEVLLAELERSTPRRRAYLLLALADRGDEATLAAAMKAAASDDLALRTEAVRILGRLGNPVAGKALLEAALDDNTSLAKEARTSLSRIKSQEIDQAVSAMLAHPEPERRLLAVELIAERQATGAVPMLMKVAGDTDEKVRVAALKTLGNLADEKQLPAVLDTLLKNQSDREIRAAGSVVTAICMRSTRKALGNVVIRKASYGDLPHGRSRDVTEKVAAMVKAGKTDVEATNGNFGDPAGGIVKKLQVEYTVNGRTYTRSAVENQTLTIAATSISPACLNAVLGALQGSSGKAKAALLGVLGTLGGEQALDAVRTAARNADPEIRETALRTLFDWPDAGALSDLTKLAREAEKPSFRILALRGYIRLVGASGALPAEKLVSLKDALSLSTRKEEKTLVLAALGAVPTIESLELVTPHLSDAALKEEACAAVLSIAQNLRGKLPPQVPEAVETVAKTARNTLIARRAKALLGKLKAKR